MHAKRVAAFKQAARQAMWLVYGLLRGDWPIIIGNIITLGLALVILALKLRYGRHR